MSAETFYRSHKYAPLASVDGIITISENELIELMEDYAKQANQPKEVKCPDCNGNGFTAEHDPNDQSFEHIVEGNCRTCPVQVQCETCEATGYLKPQQQSEVEELAKALDIYVKQKHTQEECIGFIDGFKANTLNQDKDWKRVGELANEITKIVRNETIPDKTLG